jgi:hypothetical protein
VDIIVQIDLPSAPCRRYRVERDASTVLDNLGECDMTQPSTLRSFLRWGVNTSPADSYLVVLWGHGEAWWREVQPSSIFINENGDPDAFMPNYLLRQALEGANMRPNILAFDACVMGSLEVAFELKSRAEIMVSSEELVYEDGYPYDDILEDLVRAPDQSAQELAQTIVTLFGEYYSNQVPMSNQCLSALRMSEISSVASAVDALAGVLRDRLEDQGFYDSLERVRGESETFRILVPNYVDILDLSIGLRDEFGLDTDDLESSIDDAVIENFHRGGHPNATGLSVYFPTSQSLYEEDQTYNDSSPSLFMNHDWDEFLEAFFALSPP